MLLTKRPPRRHKFIKASIPFIYCMGRNEFQREASVPWPKTTPNSKFSSGYYTRFFKMTETTWNHRRTRWEPWNRRWVKIEWNHSNRAVYYHTTNVIHVLHSNMLAAMVTSSCNCPPPQSSNWAILWWWRTLENDIIWMSPRECHMGIKMRC